MSKKNHSGNRKSIFKRLSNKIFRRKSKQLDKQVEYLNAWFDNDEEGEFSQEADFQYPGKLREVSDKWDLD